MIVCSNAIHFGGLHHFSLSHVLISNAPIHMFFI